MAGTELPSRSKRPQKRETQGAQDPGHRARTVVPERRGPTVRPQRSVGRGAERRPERSPETSLRWETGLGVRSTGAQQESESRAGGAEGRTPAVCGAAVDSRAQVSAQGEGEGDPPGLTPDGARCRSHQPGWGNAEVTAPWAVFSEQGRTGLGLTSRLDQANHNSKT